MTLEIGKFYIVKIPKETLSIPKSNPDVTELRDWDGLRVELTRTFPTIHPLVYRKGQSCHCPEECLFPEVNQ